jgi:hypothetical protein
MPEISQYSCRKAESQNRNQR